MSSEASNVIGCRSPSDVINLAAVWGLGPERGKEAVSKLARAVVVSASLKRTSYRGAVDIMSTDVSKAKTGVHQTALTKVHERGDNEGVSKHDITVDRMSKREQKRQAKRLKLDVNEQAP